MRRRRMVTQRPFEELNLWQRIFAEHWKKRFAADYEQKHGEGVPENWQENVDKMLACGDIREGYYEYFCQECGTSTKVGFTCKCKLCLRCFKTAVDGWLNQARKVLFEGVVHRQVVLTVPKRIRPLILAEAKFLKVFMDAGATAVKELIEQWRKKRKIRVGIMAVLQLHGQAGNRNPHLHFVVSEGGVDKDGKWREVNFFDTKKLRRKWQYHLITALKKAVRGTAYEAEMVRQARRDVPAVPDGV
ncbi:MAG: transposase [Acidobacteria bacterium]|nr:transposase [Acidobacteriota bacterium]